MQALDSIRYNAEKRKWEHDTRGIVSRNVEVFCAECGHPVESPLKERILARIEPPRDEQVETAVHLLAGDKRFRRAVRMAKKGLLDKVKMRAETGEEGGYTITKALVFEIPSESEPGKTYTVRVSCNCPDFKFRGVSCKHVEAALLACQAPELAAGQQTQEAQKVPA